MLSYLFQMKKLVELPFFPGKAETNIIVTEKNLLRRKNPETDGSGTDSKFSQGDQTELTRAMATEAEKASDRAQGWARPSGAGKDGLGSAKAKWQPTQPEECFRAGGAPCLSTSGTGNYLVFFIINLPLLDGNAYFKKQSANMEFSLKIKDTLWIKILNSEEQDLGGHHFKK